MALSKRVETAKAAGQTFGMSDQISLLAHDEEALEEVRRNIVLKRNCVLNSAMESFTSR